MNANRLLAYYEQIADAPDAIARLRRFILDLAVRGKLVPQDPNDEPASGLLKRIAEKKSRLLKAGEIKQVRHDPPDFGMTPNVLPSSWTWTAFGDVQELIRGVTYSKSDVGDGPSEDYVPILRANNIGIVLTHDEPVFVKRECVSVEQFLRAGDFMIALSSGSKNLVGKAAFVPKDFHEAFGGFCGVIRLVDHELQGYVRVFLQSDFYRESIAAGSRGIGINNLKKETLSNLFFPLPPLAEQNRIVAKVDELMGLCDRLEAARAGREATRDRLAAASLARLKAPDPETFQDDARFALDALPALTTRTDQVKALRQTILNLAVRGKLVPQDPNDEPASGLLKQIAQEKSQLVKVGTIKKSQELAPSSAVEKPFAIPETWSWATFTAVAAIQSNLVDPRGYKSYPHIAPDNIESGTGKLLPYDTIANSGVFSSKHLFQPGCILYSKIRPALAKATLADFEGLCSADMYPILPFIERRYLHKFMLAEVFVRQSVTEDNRVAMPKINQESLAKILIAVPPLAEQQRIVAKVDELMALCDQLEASLTNATSTRSRLVNALLVDALTPLETHDLEVVE